MAWLLKFSSAYNRTPNTEYDCTQIMLVPNDWVWMTGQGGEARLPTLPRPAGGAPRQARRLCTAVLSPPPKPNR